MNKYCVFLMQKPLAQMTCKESSFIFSYERWIAMFMTCRDFQNDFMCYLFIFLDLMMTFWSPASLPLSLYIHSHCVDRGLKVIFSQHTIQHESTVSVSLSPASFLLPCSSLPWSFLFCFWMNCFILFSLHSWEKMLILVFLLGFLHIWCPLVLSLVCSGYYFTFLLGYIRLGCMFEVPYK